MKITFKIFTLLAFFALVTTSCGEEECLDLSESIVGTWESSTLGSGNIEFVSDGTLIDEDDLIIGFEANGVAYDQKSWMLTDNDSKLSIRAESEGAGFFESELNVVSFDCESFTLEQLGISVVFNKTN